MARIDEIVDGIYRISTTVNLDGFDFQFNQFLIDDERPALIHTGMYAMYDDVRGAVREALDPGRLAYVILLHFESDECGGMDRFLDGAPDSALACSAASVQLNLSGWNYRGRVEGHQDGEVIDLGVHKLHFLETPHVHHWDSMMLFDETTKSVFPSDLFIQPGDQPPNRDREPRQRDVRLLPGGGDLRPRGPCPPGGRPDRPTGSGLDTRHARRKPSARDDPVFRARAARGAVRVPGEGARA
jgi:glyoxylase-like metal-dependent hydrolase (beta-lactamase superfamily II)